MKMTSKEVELLQQHPEFTQYMLNILTELDQATSGDEAEGVLQRNLQKAAICSLRDALTARASHKPFKGVHKDKKKS